MKEDDLDLHGLTQPEAVDALVARCNRAFQEAGGRATVRVIHGYGSGGEGGALRNRVRGFCRRYPDLLEAARGEDVDGNHGVTAVTVKGRLPEARERLGEDILRYCARPRRATAVAGRFRRHGERAVGAAVGQLLRDGRLEKRKGRRGGREYRAR